MPGDTIKTRTILVDGLQVETTDAGAAAIEKLQGVVLSLQKATADAEAKHQREIAAKDATIDDLNKKVLTDAAIEKLISDRSTLLADAAMIAPKGVYLGKSSDAIRAEAVRIAAGDAAVNGRTPEYIAARFDILLEDAKKAKSGVDPISSAFQNAQDNRGTPTSNNVPTTPQAAFDQMLRETSNSWKGN